MATGYSNYDIPDPADILAGDQQETQKGLDSVNPNARNAALGGLFSRILNGDPRVQKAQAEQTAVSTAQQDMAPQQDGESDIDYQIRRAHAVYQAVAPLDANAAQKAADNIVTLQQAKTQQKLLQTDIQDKEQTQLIQRQTQGTFVVGSSDGTKEFGTVSRFNDDGSPNPNFSTDLAALQQQNPGSATTTQQQWFANKGAIAAQQAASRAALAAAKIQASGVNDGDAVKMLAGESVLDSNAMARQSGEMRTAVAALKIRSSITPMDEAQARLQLKFLQSSATAAGRRDGNIQTLRNSMVTLGQAATDALNGVDRGNIRALNAAIVAGKTQFSDPGEARYAAAINGLVTEYGRVMAGGNSGVTSDSARADAYAILNKYQGADAVRAIVDQIANKETGALVKASDQTLEFYANPRNYRAIDKVQRKLGFQLVDGAGGDVDLTPATVNADVTGPDQKTITPRSGAPKPTDLKSRIDAILGN